MDKYNYTYIIKCNDGTYYCGWTNDIVKRIHTHNIGKGAKYTRHRFPVELVYLEVYSSKQEAMSREWNIKQLSKSEKYTMISDFKDYHSPLVLSELANNEVMLHQKNP